MPAYALALITHTTLNQELEAYLEQIDDTLRPFSGKYRVHGGPYRQLEGTWKGDLVLLEFPDMARARGWYDSAAYRAIKPLRTRNSVAAVILAEGVPETHRGRDLLKRHGAP